MAFYTMEQLFDLEHTLAKPLLLKHRYPWQALGQLADFIVQLGKGLPKEEYQQPSENIWVANTAVVAPTAVLTAPCIIQPHAEVRHCAFIRGSVLVGEGAVVGNSTELKNCILFDEAQVPHFNYVGDSVLGYRAHMGAGAVTSNLKSDKSMVEIHFAGESIPTRLQKLGAIVGDEAEVGCNSVLCPGTILGKKTRIYPTSCVRGVVPEGHIFKGAGKIVKQK